MRIFLAPRSNETSYKNFLSTIENGVDLTIVEPHLDEEGRKQLSHRKKLYVWGNKDTKKTSWDRMEIGDLVLFYKGREKKEREAKLVYAGLLLHKQHSKDLGLALWPPKKGQEPWTCIFFLENLRPIYLPISKLADYAGYSRNFIVQGFMPLRDEGAQKILKQFGTVDKFLEFYSRKRNENVTDLEERSEVTAHAEAAILLLKIGRMLGYDTYSPDKSKEAYGEKLRDHCTLDTVPTRFLGELLPIIREIDVIWFKDDVPKCAFEVEHTTKFGPGFQRLFQLNPLSVRLFIVSAEKNRGLFDKFIETDPYYRYRAAFHFRNYKQLEEFFRAVSEFQEINRAFLAVSRE
jgi:hypothetical protein